MDSYKAVKGDLDSAFNRYPTNGLTNSGGNFVYKLTITNPGNVPLKNIKLLGHLALRWRHRREGHHRYS